MLPFLLASCLCEIDAIFLVLSLELHLETDLMETVDFFILSCEYRLFCELILL